MCQSLFCGNGSQLVQTCLAISSKDFNSQYILRKKETERASKFSSGLLATTVFGSFGKDELFIHFFIYFINRDCVHGVHTQRCNGKAFSTRFNYTR